MRKTIVALASSFLVAGCANVPPRELPLPAAEMPASFAYGELGPNTAHYRRGSDPRTGAQVKLMTMSSARELAQVVVVT